MGRKFKRYRKPSNIPFTKWQLLTGSPLIRFLIFIWSITLLSFISLLFGGCVVTKSTTNRNGCYDDKYEIRKFFNDAQDRRQRKVRDYE